MGCIAGIHKRDARRVERGKKMGGVVWGVHVSSKFFRLALYRLVMYVNYVVFMHDSK